MTQQRNAETTRRGLLAGMSLAGLAGTLAACGGSAGTASGTASRGGAATAGGPGQGGGSGATLTRTSEIPLGGGKVFTSPRVVVTQPTAGEFRGFSAVCTHMQCYVDQVANGAIVCPCHGALFSVSDGHVITGPAPSPLPAQPLRVQSGQISLA